MLNDLFLARGYAVASSTLNVLDNNCSDVISAEAALMVKEHFIETYGPARYTIGWGGSGGAIQQQLIANNYPGILDGIIPASFPDATTSATVTDCRLFDTYFAAGRRRSAGRRSSARPSRASARYNSCNSGTSPSPAGRTRSRRAPAIPVARATTR